VKQETKPPAKPAAGTGKGSGSAQKILIETDI
jgi:hypothetical protein